MEMASGAAAGRRPGTDAGGLRGWSGTLVLREARPVVQAVFLLRYACAVTLTLAFGGTVDVGRILFGALTLGGCVVAIYVVNGVADVVEDRANGSRRPIASGVLPLRVAVAWAVGAALVGVGAAWFVSPAAPVVAAVLLVGGCAYSTGPFPLKNTVPTFMVVAVVLGASTYTLGMLAAGTPTPPVLVMGACLTGWMVFAGTSKDLGDVHGDRIAGRRTWPVVLGERRARRYTALTALGVAAAFLIGTLVEPWLLPSAAVLAVEAVVLAVVLGSRTPRVPPYRVFMVTQYATHAVGLATGLGLLLL